VRGFYIYLWHDWNGEKWVRVEKETIRIECRESVRFKLPCGGDYAAERRWRDERRGRGKKSGRGRCRGMGIGTVFASPLVGNRGLTVDVGLYSTTALYCRKKKNEVGLNMGC